MRGIGYWLSNGVLLGVYSQPEPILQKSTQSMMMLAADVVFADIKATSLTFGNANFTNPPATVDRQGVVELATIAETIAGKDGIRAVTPEGLTPAMAHAIADHVAVEDPHQQYLTPARGNALYFHKLPAYTDSNIDCDTLLETGVRDVLVANDRGVITATRLPMGGDGFGTLSTENGGQFVRQVYTEGGITQRTWERTGFLGAATPFEGRPWKLIWNSGSLAPDDYVKKSGDAMGALSVAASKPDAAYSAFALEIREAARATDAKGRDISYAPKMVFHWGGVCVTQLRLTAGNVLEVVSSDGAAYGALQVGSINATSSMTLGGKAVWHQGNFDPASKQNKLDYTPVRQGGGVGQYTNLVQIGWAVGDGLKATVDVTDQGYFVFGDSAMRLRWAGQPGQPPWVLGGSSQGNICVFNPAEFSVKSAASAGGAQTAERISNGNTYMQFQWRDPGGQPLYLWGSDGGDSARLAVIGNLNVAHAREADNATKVGGVPMRFAENPQSSQPYYIYGVEAGRTEITLYNRTALAVGSCVAAMYANQLSGAGLQRGSVGSYELIKNKSTSGLPGIWEQRGQVYDYGSGAVEGNESSAVLWQRVA